MIASALHYRLDIYTQVRRGVSGFVSLVVHHTDQTFEFFPEERISSYITDINETTQRLGVESVKSAGGVSAN